MSLVTVVCCQVEVSATGWSLVQRSSNECGVSKKCVIVKPRKMRQPMPQGAVEPLEKKKKEKRLSVLELYPCASNCLVVSFSFS
jgi:hypothetical protein